ncbi:transmembrane and immunoglobulin domain containing 3 [Lepus europaeus]|uniref:transmembrane and immunoglobulin domain containing 3 n=1 Tax=Lepus europaeus TaxID=9983 RepID=UPI002B474B92|nr:transmembrane and immunoglobulin domain containing 3 [Lepus europaeus]
MAVFLLFSLAVFSEAIVMDQKVKESFVMDTASAICNYNTHYKDHPKYWCRGYFRNYCNIIAFTPTSTERVALRDTGSQLIITVSCLTKEDTGWYWCGIQRDFARDEMDFTELIVSDNRTALTILSASGLSGNQNRSCRASQVVHKADRSRMSILIICILITGLGIISIISHLSKRRRRQRSRRVTGKGQVRSSKNSQISPVIPTPLAQALNRKADVACSFRAGGTVVSAAFGKSWELCALPTASPEKTFPGLCRPLFSPTSQQSEPPQDNAPQWLLGQAKPEKWQQEGMRLAVVQPNRAGAQCFEARLSAAMV